VIKVEFSASLLSVTVSHPSEIILICWFAAQETFFIIMKVEIIMWLYFLFFQDLLMNRIYKR